MLGLYISLLTALPIKSILVKNSLNFLRLLQERLHLKTAPKRKKIRSKIESDWRTYWSSSKEVIDDVKTLGEDKFKREILMFCLSKGTASYFEAKFQMQNEVLEHPDMWYNGIVNCRVHRSHIKYED